jgi:hypothetical protein
MGQRAYRGKITDSLINNYFQKSEREVYCSDAWGYSNTPQTRDTSDETQFFQGKLINLELEYDMDSPLTNLQDVNSILSKGFINSHIPKGKKINNLNLTIKSKLFGTGKGYLNQNLYILFGPHFFRDIGNIFIQLYNPLTKKYINDRKTINNILDFICFKTIKVVKINNSLMYYVIPEYSEFAIVLAYRDINFYENFNTVSHLLEELIFHPYCQFEESEENFKRCLNAIERTVPKEVNNIILPNIYFKNVDKNFTDKNLSPDSEEITKKIFFLEFQNFLKEIKFRFQIVSLELKIKFNDHEHFDDENNKTETLGDNYENYLKFVSEIILENLFILSKFTYCFLSFNFDFNNFSETISEKLPPKDLLILNHFRKILINNNLNNLALAQHINFNLKNKESGLDDQFDYYDYTFYDKNYKEKIIVFLLLSKKSPYAFNRIYKKKIIMQMILKSIYDFRDVYPTGRINFSSEMIKNKKIVPLELNRESVLAFKN